MPRATRPKTRTSADASTPLAFLLSVMRAPKQPDDVRLQAAIAAAPYVHPRLVQIEHIGHAPQLLPELDVEGLGLH